MPFVFVDVFTSIFHEEKNYKTFGGGDPLRSIMTTQTTKKKKKYQWSKATRISACS